MYHSLHLVKIVVPYAIATTTLLQHFPFTPNNALTFSANHIKIYITFW